MIIVKAVAAVLIACFTPVVVALACCCLSWSFTGYWGVPQTWHEAVFLASVIGGLPLGLATASVVISD